MKKDMDCNINPDNIPFCFGECECPPGEQEPDGDANCCCADAIKYALHLISTKDSSQEVNLISFNRRKTGKLEAFSLTDNLAILNGVSYSVCNIDLITFSKEPAPLNKDDNFTQYNCNTENCCCNEDLANLIISNLPKNPKFPISKTINILLVKNNNKILEVVKVYGICNGILWAKFKDNSQGARYAAIPLCEMFSIDLVPPAPEE